MTTLTEVKKPLQTHEIQALLRIRFDPGEYSLFWEVGDGRRADAVAINQWYSRGHAIHGIEIKASRSDWLRELKQPAKANEVMQHCDYWWLVANKDVAKPDELPMGWGLLEPRGATLRQIVKAPKLEPKPLTRRFMTLCLRREAGRDEGMIKERISRAVEEYIATTEDRIKAGIESRTRNSRDYEAKYRELLTALGGNEWGMRTDEVKKAVAIVLASGVANSYNGLRGLINTLDSSRAAITKALAELKVPDGEV